MGLRDLELKLTYDTSTDDLVNDVFVPLLSQSVRYDRAVGFFSSGWLRVASAGMIAFAANGGAARWIISPVLAPGEWKAVSTGLGARDDPVLYAALERSLDELAHDLHDDTLSALSWMVADHIIEFRIGLPRGELDGDFHDKFGVFLDDTDDRVSFNGSYNDTVRGLRNYESIKVFASWRPEFEELVLHDIARFERLWSNADPNVEVVEMPEAIRRRLLRLRRQNRPYPLPHKDFAGVEMHRARALGEPSSIALRVYQQEAIEAWVTNEHRGFLEMATGSGKTITALAASVGLYENLGRLAVVIACPFQHLVDQWEDVAGQYGYRPILAYRSRRSWSDTLNHTILEYNSGDRLHFSVICTHTTFITGAFQEALSRIRGPVLLIADEAHHLGAERSRVRLPEHVPYRLALSATPDRWYDEAGTATLHEYFGPTVFSFPLDRAIGVCLTPYYYHPHPVELTIEEISRYRELSRRIARLTDQEDAGTEDHVKMLLIRRAELLNDAENKIAVLSELVDNEEDMKLTLFYCSPGTINEVSQLLGKEKGLLIHNFTNRETAKERKTLLSGFGKGRWQALVAMHCLDEGVDVPDTRTAYIVASSGNPRQFIQRRGRVLRQAVGKEFANIHDLLAIPPVLARKDHQSRALYDSERAILRREFARVKEFASSAINQYAALDVIWEMAGHYDLLDL
jgi:superfamily II DNA or RNA helicase